MRNKKRFWKEVENNFGDNIKTEYEEGYSLKDLSIKYFNNDYYQAYIKKILKNKKVHLRDSSEVGKCNSISKGIYWRRKYERDSDYFKKWTGEMAYLLGLIYADGNIKDNCLNITFKIEDLDFLMNIKKCLKYGGNIRKGKTILKGKIYEYCSLSIRDSDIYKDLVSLGVTENKTYNSTFPYIPDEFKKDFIRGQIDGDGCVDIQYPSGCNTPQIRIRFVNYSKSYMEHWNGLMTHLGFKNKNINHRNNVYEICYSTKESIKYYNEFYYDGCLCLERKKKIFEEAIKNRSGRKRLKC